MRNTILMFFLISFLVITPIHAEAFFGEEVFRVFFSTVWRGVEVIFGVHIDRSIEPALSETGESITNGIANAPRRNIGGVVAEAEYEASQGLGSATAQVFQEGEERLSITEQFVESLGEQYGEVSDPFVRVHLRETDIIYDAIVPIECIHVVPDRESLVPEIDKGTAVIFSEHGYLLTARHISRASGFNGRYDFPRLCSASLPPLLHDATNATDVQKVRLQPIFDSADVKDIDGRNVDFVVFQYDATEAGELTYPYMKLVPELVALESDTSVHVLGYPVRDGQHSPLARYTGFFAGLDNLSVFDECESAGEVCGRKYLVKKRDGAGMSASTKGVIVPEVQNGMSGGPALYKGNFIGILTHSEEGEHEEGDGALILSSREIYRMLFNVGIIKFMPEYRQEANRKLYQYADQKRDNLD